MKGLLIAYMLIACALGFVQEIRTLEDLPVSSNTFSIDVADLESHAVEHTDIYGTPVIVFEPSPSNPILSVLGNGKIIWKNPGDECVGITSTCVTLPRLVSLRIKTIDLVVTSHFYTHIDGAWVDIDEETFISLVQQTGMHPQAMIDISKINRTVCHVSVVPMDDIDIVKVEPKLRFDVTEILEDGMTIWTAKEGEKVTRFSSIPLVNPTLVRILSEDLNGVYTTLFFGKFDGPWKPLLADEFTARYNELTKNVKKPLRGDLTVDVMNMEDSGVEITMAPDEKQMFLEFGPLSETRITKVLAGKTIMWSGSSLSCTSAKVLFKEEEPILAELELGNEDSKIYLEKRTYGWYPLCEEEYHLKVQLAGFATLSVLVVAVMLFLSFDI